MAIVEKKNIWVYSGKPEKRIFEMSASMGVLVPNSPLKLAAAGTCDRVESNNTTILGFLAGSVSSPTTWPIAAAYSVNDEVYVDVADASITYAVYMDNAGNDTAVDQANVGDTLAITVQSTTPIGYVTADEADTGNVMFTVVGLLANQEPELHKVADSPGVLLVKITGTLEG